MEISFKTKKLEKIFASDAALLKAFGQPRAKKIKQRYNEMKASTTLADLSKIPAANLHPLSADRQGQWAVKVTGKDRLCFIIDHNPVPLKEEENSVDMEAVTDVCIIEVTNYH